jgi:hypothetical protein
MASVRYPCIDRPLPSLVLPQALAVARTENPANAATPPEAAAFAGKLRVPGQAFQVQRSGGDPGLQSRVADRSSQWVNYTNLNIRFSTRSLSDYSKFVPETMALYVILQERVLADDPFKPNWRVPRDNKTMASLCYSS